jgi:hypothetical protein
MADSPDWGLPRMVSGYSSLPRRTITVPWSVIQSGLIAAQSISSMRCGFYESFGLRKTYSAAILPSRTMMTSSPV